MFFRRSRAGGPPPSAVDLSEAREFLREFYNLHPGDIRARLAQVHASVERTGTYEQTPEELEFAARLAWRNAGRCTGRGKWRTLRVRDRRSVEAADRVAAETIAHLREATSGGRVRSHVTVFAPDRPGRPGPRIFNAQAVRYAGYRRPAGGTIGDPESVAVTELAVGLGWSGPGTAFDVLPLVIRGSGGLDVFPVPGDAVLEVPITHPDFRWFGELGLRWYAVPVVSDMCLSAGGITYPCAPFNGWYQASTEVGVRDLGDEGRYNMLPAVAAGMGLDVSRVDTFWQDRAAVELAVAVHHSYKKAGVVVTDHQTETRSLARWLDDEERAGRAAAADWGWVVPPISGSTTPLFHRALPGGTDPKPAYVRRTDPLPVLTAGRRAGGLFHEVRQAH
jgi:nitric-oxide synthase